MKKLLLSAVLLMGLTGFAQATSSKTIYVTTSDKKVGSSIRTVPYNPATKQYNLDTNRTKADTPPVPSGNTAIYRGQEQPVYVSPRGKEYILVTSKKTGNVYKKYINQ